MITNSNFEFRITCRLCNFNNTCLVWSPPGTLLGRYCTCISSGLSTLLAETGAQGQLYADFYFTAGLLTHKCSFGHWGNRSCSGQIVCVYIRFITKINRLTNRNSWSIRYIKYFNVKVFKKKS